MRTGTYYLNNRGSRWVILPKRKYKCRLPNGDIIERTGLMYESFGNWGSVQISYKGVKAFYLLDKITGEIIINPDRHVKL